MFISAVQNTIVNRNLCGFMSKVCKEMDAARTFYYTANDIELSLRTSIVLLKTVFFVLWLLVWQCVPSVPCAQYACIYVEYVTARLQSLLSVCCPPPFICRFHILMTYVYYVQCDDQILGRITQNLYMQSFSRGRNLQHPQMGLVFLCSPYVICTQKITWENNACISNRQFFFLFYIHCKGRCSHPRCAQTLKS